MTVQSLKFLVQGSAESPYEVKFTLNGENLNAFCTCPAGQKGLHCKHRLSILAGESGSVISGNQDDILIVKSWLPGTGVEVAIHNMEQAEFDFTVAKGKLSRAKKELAKALLHN